MAHSYFHSGGGGGRPTVGGGVTSSKKYNYMKHLQGSQIYFSKHYKMFCECLYGCLAKIIMADDGVGQY